MAAERVRMPKNGIAQAQLPQDRGASLRRRADQVPAAAYCRSSCQPTSPCSTRMHAAGLVNVHGKTWAARRGHAWSTAASVLHREDRLAVGVLDLGGPRLLTIVDDVLAASARSPALRPSCRRSCRPRRRTSALRRLAAASCGCLCIRMKVEAGHRPGLVAGLIGEDEAEAAPTSNRRWRRRPGRPSDGRSDRLAVLVDHLRVGELVLLGVGVLDVADRALGLRDVVGDALVALGADADRPFAPRC